jgi:hypothetical protein
MIAHGYDVTVFIIWIVIHTVVMLTGLLALGRTGFVASATIGVWCYSELSPSRLASR